MPSFRKSLGDYGERLAKDFLLRQGYTIIDQHVTSRYGEIDLIARDGKELVFVEVRTRRSLTFGRPEESISELKLEKLEHAIDTYLITLPETPPYRLDCVCITFDDMRRPHIDHFKSCG